MEKKRVVVGLSGGVDSSVAAHLLIEQGYEVIGIFMKNWHDTSVTISDECPWIDDSNDALQVAEKLGIPYQTIDLSTQYKDRIVDYMFNEYEKGRTPNPDVLCNREIKFDIFLDAALKLGADFVATGHYCQKGEIEVDGQKVYQLLAGADQNKDQSYFLCQLNQDQLSKALFPIGHLQKSEVRAIAAAQDLITADKKDSQGLCFIGKVKLPDFLKQQLKPKSGDIIEIDADYTPYSVKSEFEDEKERLIALTSPHVYAPENGKIVGQHNGAHYYTIGQRKGLGVGGTKEALYVIATNTQTNHIYTGQGDHHPGLLRPGLFIPNDEVHWVREDLKMAVGEQKKYSVRIRYRQPLVGATLHCEPEGIYIIFDEDERGVAAGQFAAWYHDNELIGSGVIS
ncbi:tRNA 2-thiouridine(34) synthase MnmA [bacterium SCSIO 12643]|nr:tRNA 2-thiouridine(34) synthase MnmA [bacterium SCSIO 12643]